MAFFTFLYRNALWIAPVLFALALFSLISAIRFLVRVGRISTIASLPLVAEQPVELAGVDRVVLSGEGPIFSPRFAKLKFALVGADGRRIEGHPTLVRTHSSSMTRGKLELRSFPVPHAGEYRLVVDGLGEPQPADAECRIVLSRPHAMKNIAGTVGLVLAAVVTIGSLVLFLIRVTPSGESAGN